MRAVKIMQSRRHIDRSTVRSLRLLRVVRRVDLRPVVAAAVATRTGVSVEAMHSRRRDRPATYARHLLMYCLAELCREGATEIGRMLGRDHSSVIGGITRIRLEYRTRWQTKADVDAIREAMREAA